jgi:superfamily II DNA/RNA helicase
VKTNYGNTAPIANLKISANLKRVCKSLGFENLTPVQEEAIPVIMNSQNSAVFGETGSGKTLCYA